MDMPELPVIETEDAHKIGRKSARRPRVELLTRNERRRRWSIEQKQEIVAESLRPDTAAINSFVQRVTGRKER